MRHVAELPDDHDAQSSAGEQLDDFLRRLYDQLGAEYPMDAASQPESQAKRLKRERSASPATDNGGPRAPSPPPRHLVSTFYYDEDADFDLVSSDDVTFKIQSYHLLAASPYFRRLRSNSDMSPTLHLEFNTARAVEDILTLITRRSLTFTNPPPPTRGQDAQPEQPTTHTCEQWQLDDYFVYRMKLLVAICKRWECENLLEHVTSKMRDALALRGCNALPIFMAAAIALNDPMVCRRAFAIAAQQVWRATESAHEGPKRTLATGLPGHSKLEVAAMPFSMLEDLPTKYVAALSRAFLQRKMSKHGQVQNWDAVAQEFYRLVTAE